MTASEAIRRIGTALTEAVDEARRLDLGPPHAVGWATVELDRAAGELAGVLGLTPDAFAPAADSDVLGARCRVAHDAIGDGLALVIMEPSTEGRLASSLARHDEGPAAVWFRLATDTIIDATIASRGPFGPERLVQSIPGDPMRRFLLTVAPGTIDG